MPIWEAPDEPTHYHIAWHLARKGEYPSSKLNYETHQPRTYYYFASWVIRGLDNIDPELSDYYVPPEDTSVLRVKSARFDWNDNNYRFLLGVYLLRWINILIGAVALWINWKAYCLLVPDKPVLRISAIALTALIPEYLHIMSSVSNEAIGTLAGALIFYMAIRTANSLSSNLVWIYIPLALILPILTKLSALPAGVAFVLFAGWQLISRTRHTRSLLIIGLVSLIAMGLVYILFPNLANSAISELTWRLFSVRKGALKISYIIFMLRQIVWTYWGWVGWLAVSNPPWMINVLFAFGTMGMVSSGYAYLKNKNDRSNLILITLLIALITIGAVVRNGFTTSATRGRFLFPALGAISFLMISGWFGLLPERILNKLPIIVTLFMVAATLSLWAFGVIPLYYQPFLD